MHKRSRFYVLSKLIYSNIIICFKLLNNILYFVINSNFLLKISLSLNHYCCAKFIN
jgi:hypothetical protein